MKTSLHGFMKAGLLDYDTKAREQWVGCHPGQVRQNDLCQLLWIAGESTHMNHSRLASQTKPL